MRWFLMVLTLSLTGCLAMPQPKTFPPQTGSVLSRKATGEACQCAVQTFSAWPTAVVYSSDVVGGTFSGQVHHAVNLSLVVEAQGAGSLLTIHAAIPTNKKVTGEFDEVDTFIRMLKERCS